MYELTLENIKSSLRLDMGMDEDNEKIMKLLLPASKRQVKGAITNDEAFYTSDDEITSLFNLAVINHLAHHYENPSITTQFGKVEIPQSSLTIIQNLRGEYARWKSADLNTE